MARQMRQSLGRDALLDRVRFSKGHLTNQKTVSSKWTTITSHPWVRLISPCSRATSYQSRTDIERRCLRLARMPRLLSESG
jgi:hypothetical protein